jgi:succinyl-CoA synthetase beta subunit
VNVSAAADSVYVTGVRLEGTNVEEGQRVLRDSGLNFAVADGMKEKPPES